jgi:hypothetical protein
MKQAVYKRLKKQSNASGALAGASGGTLLLLLARQLADTNPYKPWAILIAPSVSVLIATGLFWVRSIAKSYVQMRRKEWLFAKVRESLEKCLDNPRTTPEHKEKVRKQLEELEIAKNQANLQLVLEDVE